MTGTKSNPPPSPGSILEEEEEKNPLNYFPIWLTLRIDSDYHTRNCDMPMMLGCVTAITKTTKENGATICIPGSHLWGPERCPYDHEAVPAELEPGSALIFAGNLYHAGGGNITTYVGDFSHSFFVGYQTCLTDCDFFFAHRDQARETVGIFLCKPYYRPAENQFIMCPPEVAKRLPPQAQRLLGYGISLPALGFVEYQDPMRYLFGVEDDETVNM